VFKSSVPPVCSLLWRPNHHSIGVNWSGGSHSSWAPSIWEPHFEQPPIELQEPYTFHSPWPSLWDMRSSWHLQEPGSCKLKSESSESQSCDTWFNTMIRTYKRNVCAPSESHCFLYYWVNFMMYAKWRWSTGRFNQIWVEAKYEGKFWWTYPSFPLGYLLEPYEEIWRFY